MACKRDEKCNAKNCKAYCANKILGIVIIILLLNNSIINKIITKTVAIKSIILYIWNNENLRLMVIGVIFMLVAGGWLTLEIIRTPHIETVVTFLLPHKECQIVTRCIKCLIKKYVKKSLLLGGYNIEEEEIENYITQTLNSSIKTGKRCLYYIFDEYFKKRNYIDLELWQLRISRKGLKITDTLMEYIQFGVTLIQIKIAINGPSLTDETNPGLYFMMFMLIIVETLIMVYNNTEKQNSSDNTVLQIADELLIRQNPLYNK